MSSEESSSASVDPSDTLPASAQRDRVGFAAYRDLPRTAGWAYLAATSLGRLPLSMVPLAILTLASAATGSIAVGGIAAAAAAVGEAAGAPLAGAITDRRGQRPVLLIGVVLHVAALLAFCAAAGSAPDTLTVLLAALAGLALPQVGPLSRARWLVIAPRHQHVAFAFEGVVDEVVYIVGPALVGLIAVTTGAASAVVASGALVAVFVTWFAVHPSHRLVPRRRARARSGRFEGAPASAARARLLIGVAFAGALAMGIFFGGSQTGLTSFADEQGISGAGPLLYAVMAVGSAVTTLAMVAVPARIGPWIRWTVAGAGLTAGSLLLLFAEHTGTVVVAGLVAGAFQGPLLLTMFSVSGSVTEEGRGGIVMTFTASGIVLGLAVGTTVAGLLAERFGSGGAFAVVVAVAAVQLLLGAGMQLATAQRRASRA
ncbi:MAG: MFS transporter [Microbacterium sp.]